MLCEGQATVGQFQRIPGLKLINLVQPTAILKEAYRYFAGHTCQMHIESCAEGEPWTLPGQFADHEERFISGAIRETNMEKDHHEHRHCRSNCIHHDERNGSGTE